MRSAGGAIAALAVVILVGIAAIVYAGATRDGTAGLDLGIPADAGLATLTRGDQACEGPISLDEPVRTLEFTPALGGTLGPPIRVEVRDFDSGERLAAERVPPEVMTGGPKQVRFDRPVGEGRTVDVCMKSEGRQPVQIWGDPSRGTIRDSGLLGAHPTLSLARARVDGREVDGDFFVRFPGTSRSYLADAPDVIDRAGAFRAPWYGAWSVWLLAGALLIGLPLGIAAAIRLAARES